MSIVRRGPLPTDHFTIISNAWTRDESLTWEARGLLTWLAGHAAGHDVTEDTIVAAGPAGVRAVRTMIKDLTEAGYLRRDRTYNVAGGSSVDYVLTDPRECRNSTLPEVLQQHPRADQAKQAENREDPQVSPEVLQQHPRSFTENHEKNKETSSLSRAPRSDGGTRIPEDFAPTDELRAWFVAEKLGGVIDGRIEHEQFMDYWRAVPGVKGRKKDWPATWRRWMRTAAERAQRTGYARPVSGPPGTSLMPSTGVPPYSTASTTNRRVMEGLALVEKFRQMEENQP